MNQTKMEDQNLEALIEDREIKKSTIAIPIIIYVVLSVSARTIPPAILTSRKMNFKPFNCGTN